MTDLVLMIICIIPIAFWYLIWNSWLAYFIIICTITYAFSFPFVVYLYQKTIYKNNKSIQHLSAYYLLGLLGPYLIFIAVFKANDIYSGFYKSKILNSLFNRLTKQAQIDEVLKNI